jgi:hypothetical protein
MVGVDAGWAGPTDDRWHTGAIDFPAGQEDPDGGEWLLELLLDDSPEAYRRFAEEYYELKLVDLATVSEVYALRPLTPGRWSPSSTTSYLWRIWPTTSL